MVATAGNDPDWAKPGAEWQESSKALGHDQKSKFYLFAEMVHGWVPRGDVKVENIARDVDLALNHALEFIRSL